MAELTAGASAAFPLTSWPLTVFDDHSRHLPGPQACADACEATVRERSTPVFERCGLPAAMITDNGNPPILKLGGQQNGPTRLTVWLIRLGTKSLWSSLNLSTQGGTRRPWASSRDCTAR